MHVPRSEHDHGSSPAGYAVVTKCLGDCRVDVECDDGETRKGEIRGALRNKTFIRPVSVCVCV